MVVKMLPPVAPADVKVSRKDERENEECLCPDPPSEFGPICESVGRSSKRPPIGPDQLASRAQLVSCVASDHDSLRGADRLLFVFASRLLEDSEAAKCPPFGTRSSVESAGAFMWFASVGCAVAVEGKAAKCPSLVPRG
ncbi:hypothetical protein CAOG_009497 [Capsaspora owczarzaki ATCC 30864]|uniref:Uncharacterized protein n=1 Tax=Capsaspora owczarzaki (strain ATCC 30864) TaxID=595528 RepID=A0A0D2X1I5_CAPO3|nr:hypothetical protein CAOG_009497 [Capsaspora owczarzaki ATCC 30864]